MSEHNSNNMIVEFIIKEVSKNKDEVDKGVIFIKNKDRIKDLIELNFKEFIQDEISKEEKSEIVSKDEWVESYITTTFIVGSYQADYSSKGTPVYTKVKDLLNLIDYRLLMYLGNISIKDIDITDRNIISDIQKEYIRIVLSEKIIMI